VGDQHVVALGGKLGGSIGVALYDAVILGIAALITCWAIRSLTGGSFSPFRWALKVSLLAAVVSFARVFATWPNDLTWWTSLLATMVVASISLAAIAGVLWIVRFLSGKAGWPTAGGRR
jgi:hypothetical protein